jgi:ATP-dependent helicase/nuclease subunit B
LSTQTGWLGTRLCEAMDLATPRTQRAAQWDAFNLLMNRPGVICLHRHAQGSEPLEASAWLEKWSAQLGIAIEHAPDARLLVEVPHEPTRMPHPTLASHTWALPLQVTATSYEALRQCPYRFFATGVLGLREQDELDEGLDRSDFGIWLHEVLRRFHLQRQSQLALSTAQEDVATWLSMARDVMKEQGLDRDSQRPYFLPFEADLDRLAEGYVQWLRGHEDEGWSVRHAEAVAERPIDIGEGVTVRLKGQLDRVDTRHVDGRRHSFVLDYKTGNLLTLKSKVAAPLEDTQLAFYAALSPPDEKVSAAYLHLDARNVTQVDHGEVEASAEALLEGLSQDWIRLHGGTPMAAMGEGAACAFCQARGLCRKDHWSAEEEPASS